MDNQVVINQPQIDKGKLLNFYTGKETSVVLSSGGLYFADCYGDSGVTREFNSPKEAMEALKAYNASVDNPTPYVLGISPLNQGKFCFYQKIDEASNDYGLPENKIDQNKFYLVKDLLTNLPDDQAANLAAKYLREEQNG